MFAQIHRKSQHCKESRWLPSKYTMDVTNTLAAKHLLRNSNRPFGTGLLWLPLLVLQKHQRLQQDSANWKMDSQASALP